MIITLVITFLFVGLAWYCWDHTLTEAEAQEELDRYVIEHLGEDE